MRLAVGHALLAPLELDQLLLDVRLEPDNALLDLGDLDAPVLHLGLDLGAQPHGLLPRLDLGLTPLRLDLALDVREDLRRASPRPRGLATSSPCAARRSRDTPPATSPTSTPTSVSISPPSTRDRLSAATAAVAHIRHSACRRRPGTPRRRGRTTSAQSLSPPGRPHGPVLAAEVDRVEMMVTRVQKDDRVQENVG